MSLHTNDYQPARKTHRIAPRYVTYSAVAAPIMVLTGWALFAAVPIALMAWGSWTDTQVRALRWWTSLTAGLYAIALLQYLTRADAEASMSALLHPALGVAIAAAAGIVAIKIFRSHRG
tara:strand:- start:5923 stop:6279 length:357 start_codon:yes stop_codon:yes gene_type:complete